MPPIVLPYRVVDVFASRAFEGNPLTIVDAQRALPTQLMQAIAQETNHSETTFITGAPRDGAHPVRIFTPASELPFAGHPTLGTGWFLGQQHGFPISLQLGAGVVPLQLENGRLTMRQPQPKCLADVDSDLMSRSLGVAVEGPCQQWSAGAPAVMVRVPDSAAVRKARFDHRLYDEAGGTRVTGIYVFTTKPDVPGLDVHARFFADFVGIPEDPATGSAVGLMAAWRATQEPASAGKTWTVGQGIEMGRPSRLYASAQRVDETWDVRVGGSVVPVAQGTFTLEIDEET